MTWYEAPAAFRLTVHGRMSTEEVLALSGGLRRPTDEEWTRSLVAEGPERDDVISTTIPPGT